MLFNSFEFLVFFICVYGLYVCLSHRWQNRMLLIASYVFYGYWDWRFLSLILVSTVVDYFCAIKIDESSEKDIRTKFLYISLATNLGILGFFKYFDFFASSFLEFIGHFGITPDIRLIHIILPVGISFYTFQTLSYTIDVYRKQMRPSRHFLDFALFVAFFPQLVAGPIERAKHLLPQILNPRKITPEWFRQGCFLILWGYYLKTFIADNLAYYVDPVFADPAFYSGSHIWVALYAFAFQIYCDFAGYSLIARGLGRLMGIDIMINFDVPYLSTTPKEFWKRWHISLSTWLKDYLYIPLGGNRHGTLMTLRNLLIVMALGGLWHGANWTFVFWGIYHGILLVIYFLLSPIVEAVIKRRSALIQKILKAAGVVVLFHLVCIGWLFFRAGSMNDAWIMFAAIARSFPLEGIQQIFSIAAYLYLLFFVDFLQYKHGDIFAFFRLNRIVKYALYGIIGLSIAVGGIEIQKGLLQGERQAPKQFIYFQF